jgi:hypothetical protein
MRCTGAPGCMKGTPNSSKQVLCTSRISRSAQSHQCRHRRLSLCGRPLSSVQSCCAWLYPFREPPCSMDILGHAAATSPGKVVGSTTGCMRDTRGCLRRSIYRCHTLGVNPSLMRSPKAPTCSRQLPAQPTRFSPKGYVARSWRTWGTCRTTCCCRYNLMDSNESRDEINSHELNSSVCPSQRTLYSRAVRPSPRSFVRQSVTQLTERPSDPMLARFRPRFSSRSEMTDGVDVLRKASVPFERLCVLLSSVLPGSEHVGQRTFFEGRTLTEAGRQVRQYLQSKHGMHAKARLRAA